MTRKAGFSDQDLSAYLDGEAPAARMAEIDAELARDPVLRARLEAMRAGQAAFVETMEAALQAAPAPPAWPSEPSARPGAAWRVALAGAAAGAIAAVGLTWGLSGLPHQEDPGWREVVANYQSLYITETLSSVAVSPAAQKAGLDHLSGVLGIDLTGLPQVPGLTYKRAQHLGYEGQPLAQLTFLTDGGGPVALCVVETGAGTSPDIRAEVMSGLDTYSWTDNGFGVILVGPKGETGLEEVAKKFRAALKTAPI